MNTGADLAIGRAVRALRKRLGWDQAELARRAGLEHPQTVSRIERGEQPLKAVQVVRLAAVLHVSATDLLAGQVPPEQPVVLWREPSGHPSRREEEALFLDRCRRYALLEEIVGAGAEVPLPQFDLDLQRDRFEDVEAWAENIRGALGLGEIPAAGLRDALERRWAVKLFRGRLQAGSAATTRGSFGNAIIEHVRQSPGRQAFTLAHELFHLVTWDSVARLGALEDRAAERNEQLANVFASALLMPEAVIRRAVTRRRPDPTRFIDLVPVARSFAVSLPALLWRLVSLGLLSGDDVRRFLDPARPWGTTDPGWVVDREELPELPERYALLAFRAWVQTEISIGKLAELMETTVGMLEPVLARYGLTLDADEYEAEVLR